MSGYEVGQYCVIEDDVTLGDGVKLCNFVHLRHGVVLHDGVEIRDHCWIGAGTVIGRGTRVSGMCSLTAGMTIGENCFIGPGVITMNDRKIVYPDPDKTFVPKTPHIGNSVKIGGGALILPGVVLNDKCIVGAGSVVTRDIPAGETWVGNPARKMKT